MNRITPCLWFDSVTALNGGPQFKFNEAVSFQVPCRSQEEVDDYWDKLYRLQPA